MNLIRFVYNNLWRDGTIETTYYSSQEPQFPAVDTQSDTLDLQWRTTNDTDDPTYIYNDLGSAKIYNYVALLGHNIPESATIKIRGADDADFAGGDLVEDEITWNAGDIYFYLPASRTKQFVQIQITTPGNPDDYIQISTVVVGSYFESNCNQDWGYTDGDHDPSELSYSDAMVLHVQERDKLFEGIYFFKSLNDITAGNIEALITYCGIGKAFIICFDHANPNTTSHWIRLTETSHPKAIFLDTWTWQMRVVEVK